MLQISHSVILWPENLDRMRAVFEISYLHYKFQAYLIAWYIFVNVAYLFEKNICSLLIRFTSLYKFSRPGLLFYSLFLIISNSPGLGDLNFFYFIYLFLMILMLCGLFPYESLDTFLWFHVSWSFYMGIVGTWISSAFL